MTQALDRAALRKWLAEFIANGGSAAPASSAGQKKSEFAAISLFNSPQAQREAKSKAVESARKKLVEAGKKGRKFDELDHETKKLLINAGIKREQAEHLLKSTGTKIDKPWYKDVWDAIDSPVLRTLDVISRGNYASAEAAKRAQAEVARQFQGDGLQLGDLDDLVKEGVKGAASGAAGKSKTFYADGIQQFADIKAAQKDGRGVDEITPGEGKVPGGNWTKYGVGFAADVALDPLTYLTFGGGAAVKGAQVAKRLEDAAKVSGELKKLVPSASAEDLAKLSGATTTPVGKLKRRHTRTLSDEAKALADLIAPIQGKKFDAKKAARTYTGQKLSNGKTVGEVLSGTDAQALSTQIVNQYKNRRWAEEIEEIAKRAGVKPPRQAPKQSPIGPKVDDGVTPTNPLASEPGAVGRVLDSLLGKPAAAPKVADEAAPTATIKSSGSVGKMQPQVADRLAELYRVQDGLVAAIKFPDTAPAEVAAKTQTLQKVQDEIAALEKTQIVSSSKVIKNVPEETAAAKVSSIADSELEKVAVAAVKGFGPKMFREAEITARVPGLSAAQARSLVQRLVANGIAKRVVNNKGKVVGFRMTDKARAWADSRGPGTRAAEFSHFAAPTAKAIPEQAVAPAVEAMPKAAGISHGQVVTQLLGAPAKTGQAASKKAGFKIDPKIESAINKKIAEELEDSKKILSQVLGKDSASIQAQIADTLAYVALRASDPNIPRALQIKVGRVGMVDIPAERAIRAVSKMFTPKYVQAATEQFDKTFRAMAGIPPEIQHLRAAHTGQATIRARFHAHNITSVLRPSKDALKTIQSAWLNKADDGLTPSARLSGTPVANPAQWISREFKEVQGIIDELDTSHVADWIKPLVKFDVTSTDRAVINREGLRKLKEKDPSSAKLAEFYNTENWLEEAARSWYKNASKNGEKVEDIDHLLYKLRVGAEQAAARQALYETAGQAFGVRLIKREVHQGGQGTKTTGYQDPLVRNLKNHYRTTNLPGLDDVYFEPTVANALEQLHKIMRSPKTVDGALKVYDRALTSFKSLVTRYNPTFHQRTLVGEIMLNYLGGVTNPKWYQQSAKVLYGRGQQFYGDAERLAAARKYGASTKGLSRQQVDYVNMGIGDDVIDNAAKYAGPSSGRAKVMRHPTLGDLTSDQIYAAYVGAGLKSGYLAGDLENVVSMGMRNRAATATQNVTESIEDYPRLAHFMKELSTSRAKTLDEAARDAALVVRKYHLDYTAVTQFEKSWATRAIPFYKWLRLSTPLMMNVIATQPGRAAVVPKVLRNVSGLAGYDVSNGMINSDAVVPEWLRESGGFAMFQGLPFADDGGNTFFFNPVPTFPIASAADLPNQDNPLMAVLRNMTPFAKVPFEQGYNASPFGKPSQTGRIDHLAQSLGPQTNLINKMIDPEDPQIDRKQILAEFLANIGFAENTDKRQKAAAKREETQANQYRSEAKKAAGAHKDWGR